MLHVKVPSPSNYLHRRPPPQAATHLIGSRAPRSTWLDQGHHAAAGAVGAEAGRAHVNRWDDSRSSRRGGGRPCARELMRWFTQQPSRRRRPCAREPDDCVRIRSLERETTKFPRARGKKPLRHAILRCAVDTRAHICACGGEEWQLSNIAKLIYQSVEDYNFLFYQIFKNSNLIWQTLRDALRDGIWKVELSSMVVKQQRPKVVGICDRGLRLPWPWCQYCSDQWGHLILMYSHICLFCLLLLVREGLFSSQKFYKFFLLY